MRKLELARYILKYIEEERERGNEITEYTVADAIEAFEGGAR